MALFQNASKALRKWGPAALTTFFMAANANAADTNVPIKLTCYTKPEDIAAVKKTITEGLGMIATTSHFTNAGTNDTPNWAMATLMRNPETRKGYEWIRRADGHVCISKSYSNIELYLNTQLNSKAFLDKKSAPKADDVGNGKDISESGINAVLIASAQNGEFPMYRGDVNDIIGSRISGVAQSRSPIQYTEYLVANPNTGEGTVLASRFNGLVIKEYTSVVGTPEKDGVKFGAIFTPAGQQIVDLMRSPLALR